MVKTTQFENKYKKVRLLLVATFGLIIFGLSYLRNITANLRTSKTRIAEVERDITLLNQIQQDIKQYSQMINEVKSTLPSEYYEISFFTKQLEKLAENSNLTTQIAIDEEKKKEKDTYSSIGYSLNVTGNYISISDFLSQISKLPYHTSVDNLEISSGAEGTIAKVKLRLFIQK